MVGSKEKLSTTGPGFSKNNTMPEKMLASWVFFVFNSRPDGKLERSLFFQLVNLEFCSSFHKQEKVPPFIVGEARVGRISPSLLDPGWCLNPS